MELDLLFFGFYFQSLHLLQIWILKVKIMYYNPYQNQLKLHNIMKKFKLNLLILLLCPIYFSLSINLASQDISSILQSEDFASQLAENIDSQQVASSTGNENSDTAFIDNSIQQLDGVSKKMMEAAWQREQLERMREAATKLCELDKRACYLIENYRTFISENDKSTNYQNLPLFGTELFSSYPLSFDVIDNAPVPDSYVVNTGDVLHISISGASGSSEGDVTVMRDGSIYIKSIGEISVAGKKYPDAIKEIQKYIQEIRVGTNASISMKSARSMNIFILGATERPGSHRIGAQASVLNALSAIGGLSSNASLRFIEIVGESNKREKIDLYKPLIYGEMDQTMLLSDGNSILIPAAKNIVTVYGAVNRPSKYEFLEGETLESAIDFALGFTPNADQASISIRRRNNFGQYDVISSSNRTNFTLQNGDVVLVNELQGDDRGYILVEGATRNSGLYSFNQSLKFSDYINPDNDLLNNAYPVFMVRKSFDTKTKSWKFNNYTLTNKESISSIEIASNDHFYIFSYDDIRFLATEKLQNLLQNVHDTNIILNTGDFSNNLSTSKNSQDYDNDYSCIEGLVEYVDRSFYEKYSENINLVPQVPSVGCPDIFVSSPILLAYVLDNSIPVFGALRKPSLYPIASKTSIQDVLKIAGGSREQKTEVEFGFADNSDLYSYIKVKNNYSSKGIDTITLIGQFNNPGIYKIEPKETLSDLVDRAGGLRDDAYPLGGIFTRESIKVKEQQALEKASKELADLLSTAITSGYLKQDSADLINLMSIMNQANTIEASGRLITNLDVNSLRGTKDDFFVMSGDTFYMPQRPHSVTISGNVLNPLTVSYSPELSYKDYVNLAGGFKENASEKNTFIILPNGKTIKPTDGLFGRGSGTVLAGSSIIVPRSARPLSGLSLVEVLSPTLANLSVTAASIAAISKD